MPDFLPSRGAIEFAIAAKFPNGLVLLVLLLRNWSSHDATQLTGWSMFYQFPPILSSIVPKISNFDVAKPAAPAVMVG